MNLSETENAMTEEYKRGYAKGYYTGSKGAWPSHRPPAPPDPLIRKLYAALQGLRDAVDAEISTFGEEDDVTQRLAPHVDYADQVCLQVGDWLVSHNEAPAITS